MTEPEDVQRHIKKTPEHRMLLLGLLAIVLVVTVTGGWFWGRHVRSSRSKVATPAVITEKTESVVLYFPFGDHLERETREVPETKETVALGTSIVQALLAGPDGTFDRVMFEGTELRSFFMDVDGVAYIDVDRKALAIPRDALSSYLSIQSFFQSLKRNIPEVSAVKFLIDAREVDSLWGHFDAAAPWNLPYEER